MMKNLFTKHDRRSFAGITKEQAMQAAGWFWRYRQFGITYTSPYSLRGGQFYSRLGLRQSVDVWAVDDGPNIGVDVTFSAELTDEGAVVGVVGALLVLPITVAVGAVSYIEYENDAQRLMTEFWSYVYNFPKNPQPPSGSPPAPTWAQGQVSQAAAQPISKATAKTCSKCKSVLDQDSKFCKHCGAKL
ncbi:MAG: zinc ribbon domain-containing protein [Thermoplasmatota archaeon]|nr:zinc ribbon domain-containing protein [Candidatus Thermoplasmatota archaeon]